MPNRPRTVLERISDEYYQLTASERKVVDAAIDRALDAAACVIEYGVSEAQNRFNAARPDPEPLSGTIAK